MEAYPIYFKVYNLSDKKK